MCLKGRKKCVENETLSEQGASSQKPSAFVFANMETFPIHPSEQACVENTALK